MMKSGIFRTFIAFLFILGFSNIYSEISRNKMIFLPFNNNSDLKMYANSDLFRDIFSRSLYASIRNYSNENSLNYFFASENGIAASNIQSFCDSENARFAVYGNYRFQGDKSSPKIIVELAVYDAEKKTNIFNKTYQTATGQSVFNDIDLMIAEVIKNAKVITGKTIVISPTNQTPVNVSNISAAPEYAKFHTLLLTFDYDIATVEFQYFLGRYFWFGAGTGYSIYTSGNAVYTYTSPMAQAGLLLVGDMQSYFRLGAGIIARWDIVFAPAGSPAYTSPAFLQYETGAFIDIEFSIFTIQPEVYMGFGSDGKPVFSSTAAVGLHF